VFFFPSSVRGFQVLVLISLGDKIQVFHTQLKPGKGDMAQPPAPRPKVRACRRQVADLPSIASL
jgi:hypothetical protein